jgi:hypothetical protein
MVLLLNVMQDGRLDAFTVLGSMWSVRARGHSRAVARLATDLPNSPGTPRASRSPPSPHTAATRGRSRRERRGEGEESRIIRVPAQLPGRSLTWRCMANTRPGAAWCVLLPGVERAQHEGRAVRATSIGCLVGEFMKSSSTPGGAREFAASVELQPRDALLCSGRGAGRQRSDPRRRRGFRGALGSICAARRCAGQATGRRFGRDLHARAVAELREDVRDVPLDRAGLKCSAVAISA